MVQLVVVSQARDPCINHIGKYCKQKFVFGIVCCYETIKLSSIIQHNVLNIFNTLICIIDCNLIVFKLFAVKYLSDQKYQNILNPIQNNAKQP